MTPFHRRRTAALAATSVALALALSACSGSSGSSSSDGLDLSSPAPKGVTITMWHASNDPRALLDLYKAYEKASGNTIKLVDIPNDNGPTVIQTKWATGDRPDVLEYNPSPQDMAQLNMSQNMIDLSSLAFVKDSKLSGVAGAIDGKTYGAILGPMSVFGMYYNKDALAKAGIQAPTNAKELMSACTALKSAGVTPISMAGGSEWPAMMLPAFTYMSDANKDNAYGQGVADGKIKVNASGSPLVAGLQLVAYLRDAGCFNSDTATATFEKSEAAVAAGTAALTFLPSDNIPDFYKAADASTVDSSLGFGAFFAVEGIPSYGPGSTGSFFAPKTTDTAKQRVAVDFVSRIRSQEKFDSVDDLVAVMNTDVEKTRDLLC